MIRQIRILTKAQLGNFFNINVARHSKDKKKKAGMIAIMAVWVLLIAMVWFYIGLLAYGYVQIGLGEIVPMYLVAISGIVILVFGILKAGSIIFQKNSYEMLCSLPVSQTAIVVSRFLSMYLGNFLMAVVVMLPGMAVYGYLLRPGISFYLIGIVGTIFIPLLPMTLATLMGAVVTAVASRMKHKSMVTTVLTLAFVGLIMLLSSRLSAVEEEMTMAMLLNLANFMTNLIGRLYPPAVWLGKAMVSWDLQQLLLFLGVSVLLFLVMAAAVSGNFSKICQGLFNTYAKHDYQMTELKSASVLAALYKKEMKRYFASSIYVTNTIIGPIMMLASAIAVFVAGEETIRMYFPFMEDVTGLLPFVMGAIAGMCTTTCASISIEGKEWWLVKSLPVSTKAILDSKLLLNATLNIPCYVLSEILLILALKPTGLELVWMIVLPILFMVFSAVFGITANLWFPNFEWKNEAEVVKQGISVLVGGFGGSLIIVLCALPVVFLPQIPGDVTKLVVTVVMMGVTGFLYWKNARVDLRKIG